MSSPFGSASFVPGHTSRLPGFAQRTLPERAALVAQWANLSSQEQATLLGLAGLQPSQADQIVENVVGTYALPLAVAVNFQVNGADVLVPMAVEEPAVVAACSEGAELTRTGGGFTCQAQPAVMVGQVQVLDLPDLDAAGKAVLAARAELLAAADARLPAIAGRGGGARDVEVRPLPDTAAGPMLVVHLLFDTRDDPDANVVDAACEAIAPLIAESTGGRVNLRVRSSLADRRLVRAECMVPAAALAKPAGPASPAIAGETVAQAIVEADAFANADPHRAATHNRGILTAIDGVAVATGNDWRAVEAGAHAFAARGGRYAALTAWRHAEDGGLHGALEVPLCVALPGSGPKSHPSALVALKILGVKTPQELAHVMAAAGLAQSLGALRALAGAGIRPGHLRAQARQLAIAAGAAGDMVEKVAAQLVAERELRLERAQEVVAQLAHEPATGSQEPEGGAG